MATLRRLDPRLARWAAHTAGPATLAVAAFVLLAPAGAGWAGFLAGWAALGAAGWASHPAPLGRQVAPRAVVAAGFLAAGQPETGTDWPLVATAGLLLLLLLHEPPLRKVVAARFQTANLPLPDRGGPDPRSLAWAVWLANTGLIGLTGLLPLAVRAAGWSPPTWPLLLAAAGAAAVSAVAFADAWNRRRRRRSTDLARLRAALEQHRPAFLLHFSSVPGMDYQATMWLPYLERIGQPFFVLLREAHALPAVTAATRAPVVVCPTLAALDSAIVPSLRAAFYVNNGMKNGHCVRFAQLTHVQLLHGDSDKAPSYNPVTAMFDQIFVAGQAGIDRYAANGVQIPRAKFRMVGRPQVDGVQVVTAPVREVAEQTVLYAPTWVGLYSDVNYSSLPIAGPIVRSLLDRGVTVILRHHPFAKRDRRSAARLRAVELLLAEDRERTGRRHRWGRAATEDLTFLDCVNRSDAMISDVSAVVSDYLYSGKPFAITDMAGDGDAFPQTFPLARVAYPIRPDASNLAGVLDQLLDRDPQAAARREARTYYLGDFPPDRYADPFLAAARECLAGLDPPAADPGPPTADPAPVRAAASHLPD